MSNENGVCPLLAPLLIPSAVSSSAPIRPQWAQRERTENRLGQGNMTNAVKKPKYYHSFNRVTGQCDQQEFAEMF